MTTTLTITLLITALSIISLAFQLYKKNNQIQPENTALNEALVKSFQAQQPKTLDSKFNLLETTMSKEGKFYNNAGTLMETPAQALHWLNIEKELKMCISGIIITTLYIDDTPATKKEKECQACG